MRRRFDQITPSRPKGWPDIFLQIGMFVVAYMGYQLVRGIAEGKESQAIANGQHVIDLEKATGTFFEPGLQRSLLDHGWVIDFANFMYLNSHFVVTTTFLAWLYLRRNDSFYFVRNMFMIAMAIAIAGYMAYPTAPPRMFGESGFIDTISAVNDNSGIEKVFVNPFAAIPSMHCGFSLMVGATGFIVSRHRVAKVFWALYPLLVFFVVMVTANHFWFDGALGWLVACLSAAGALQLARYRESWTFGATRGMPARA